MRITVSSAIDEWFWRVEDSDGKILVQSFPVGYETPEDAWHDAIHECRRKGLL